LKVLWITNILLPEPSIELGIAPLNIGGWMNSLAELLRNNRNVNLSIATVYNGFEDKSFIINNIEYFLISNLNKNKSAKELGFKFEKLTKKLNPDLVHIHGTENYYGLAFMNACPKIKSIVSIQGLVGVYARYYLANISLKDIIKTINLREIILCQTIFHKQNLFYRRGRLEKMYFRKSDFLIGRTSWDYAHAKAIKYNVQYKFCNETLRDIFYTSPKWDISKINNQTIFICQGSFPLKGFHQLLKAVFLLKSEFPSIEIRVAGEKFVREPSLINKLRITGYSYGHYIYNLIIELGIKVAFLGNLSSEEMAKEYLNAHISVCPSSIENSPNSIGEAQIIGVPIIASYVGGIPDMVSHEITGLLYRFEEIEMLANSIRRVFNDDELAQSLSKNEINVAENRHGKATILNRTIEIYNELYGGNK
jgi:L-malate glycosyltransferase